MRVSYMGMCYISAVDMCYIGGLGAGNTWAAKWHNISAFSGASGFSGVTGRRGRFCYLRGARKFPSTVGAIHARGGGAPGTEKGPTEGLLRSGQLVAYLAFLNALRSSFGATSLSAAFARFLAASSASLA